MNACRTFYIYYSQVSSLIFICYFHFSSARDALFSSVAANSRYNGRQPFLRGGLRTTLLPSCVRCPSPGTKIMSSSPVVSTWQYISVCLLVPTDRIPLRQQQQQQQRQIKSHYERQYIQYKSNNNRWSIICGALMKQARAPSVTSTHLALLPGSRVQVC